MTDPMRPTPPLPGDDEVPAWAETGRGNGRRPGDNQPCTRDEPCFQSLAEGWILVTDLCGPCTSKLMAALDRENGAPLSWRHDYLDRAKEGQQP